MISEDYYAIRVDFSVEIVQKDKKFLKIYPIFLIIGIFGLIILLELTLILPSFQPEWEGSYEGQGIFEIPPIHDYTIDVEDWHWIVFVSSRRGVFIAKIDNIERETIDDTIDVVFEGIVTIPEGCHYAVFEERLPADIFLIKSNLELLSFPLILFGSLPWCVIFFGPPLIAFFRPILSSQFNLFQDKDISFSDDDVFTIRRLSRILNCSEQTVVPSLKKAINDDSLLVTRVGEIIHIKKIKHLCQVCKTSGDEIPFLKCKSCSRDICWDHFLEMEYAGKITCPHCDGSLVFLPQVCEECRVDYLSPSKRKNVCEICGFKLSVSSQLSKEHKSYQSMIKVPRSKSSDNEIGKKDLIMN